MIKKPAILLFLLILILSTTLFGQTCSTFPFFPIENVLKDKTHPSITEEDIQLLKELGYDGLCLGPHEFNHSDKLKTVLGWLDERKLTLFAVWLPFSVHDDGHFSLPDEESLELLKGRKTALWIIVKGRGHGQPTDEQIAKAVASLADQVRPLGLPVVLYPHFGDPLPKVSDNVHIAERTDRDNVFVTFNLCHHLKSESPDNIEQTLMKAAPLLKMVSINGAFEHKKDWGNLIMPLDEGDFDIKAFLQMLKKCGYEGPVGLQGHAVNRTLPVPQNLKRSMKAWRKIHAEEK